jgi:hypothetical protein
MVCGKKKKEGRKKKTEEEVLIVLRCFSSPVQNPHNAECGRGSKKKSLVRLFESIKMPTF